MVYGFFAYAAVNFLLFITKAPKGGGGANPPAVVWRGFSGHWMAFYSAALGITVIIGCSSPRFKSSFSTTGVPYRQSSPDLSITMWPSPVVRQPDKG